MSLVAYDASSDEESDSDEETTKAVIITKANISKLHQQQPSSSKGTSIVAASSSFNGYISDENEDFTPAEDELPQSKKPTLNLPPPKKCETTLILMQELEENITPAFAKLPMPRTSSAPITEIIEEDDEFLHKKAVPIDTEQKPKPPLTSTAATKGPVKITIPSLNEFSDVEKDLATRAKNKIANIKPSKGSSLLSILPKAKSEQDFSRTTQNSSNSNTNIFVPDSVKNRRPAQNTEGVDGLRVASKKPPASATKPKSSLVDCSDSDEGSDTEINSDGDFFSLNSKESLPAVSVNEINSMVAKRAAKMTETTNKYLNSMETSIKAQAEEEAMNEEVMLRAQKRYHDQQNLDAQAVQALVGASAKRRRKYEQEIQVMDISSEQVLPDREEWMRTALASSTAYQPTGVLVDEEPASGTRRKHQITYLAHKAKANEAELQAMWAANRQTRRATQSKYGF